jgi:glutamate synthase domain-containing protein 1
MKAQGLYDPAFEHDSCGKDLSVILKEKKPRHCQPGPGVLRRLSHRGATGADPKTGMARASSVSSLMSFFPFMCGQKN